MWGKSVTDRLLPVRYHMLLGGNNVTNDEIKNILNEVHNIFWVKWRNKVPERGSYEWEQFIQDGGELMKKYSYCSLVIKNVNELIGEMTDRMEAMERDARKKER